MGKRHWHEIRAPYSWSVIFGKSPVQWHQSWYQTQADLRDITSLLHQKCWTSCTSICSPGLLARCTTAHSHWHTCKLWSYVYIYMYLERSAVARWQSAVSKFPVSKVVSFTDAVRPSCCQSAPCGPGGPAVPYLRPPADDFMLKALLSS